MNYSIIEQSNLRKDNRMDAEFFSFKDKLSSIQMAPLEQLCEFIQTGPAGSTLPASEYTLSGIPIIRPSNLDEGLCDAGEQVFISKEFLEKKRLYLYNHEDILLSRIGNLKCAMIYGFTTKVTISSNLVGLRVKQKILDPYFLLTLLQTQFARDQLERKTKMVSLASLEITAIKNLQIPLLSLEQQKTIGKLMHNSLEARLRAKELRAEAEKKLLSHCHSHAAPAPSLPISLSTIQQTKRLDAEYFIKQPGSKYLWEKGNSVKLGTIATFKRGIEVGQKSYQAKGIPFWRVGNITKYGLITKSQKYISQSLYEKLAKKYQPGIGDILLVKDGKPGVCFVMQEETEGILSEGIIRIKVETQNFASPKLHPIYLSLCIGSEIGNQQIQQEIDGTLLPHLKITQIKELVIPIVKKDQQTELINLMRESYTLQKLARQLQEEAKSCLTTAIL